MIDTQHCFMNQDEFDRYEDCYDFTEENRKMARKLQEKYKGLKDDEESTFIYKITEKEVENNDDEDDEDGSWEDIESETEGGSSESEMGEDNPEKMTIKREFFKLRRAKVLSTGELRLPSGKVAGHRDYIRYYKQKLRMKEDVNPVKQLMQDRAMRRKFITMQMGMVAKAQGMQGINQLMIRNYGVMLNRIRKKMERANKAHVQYRKRRWVK